MHRSTPPPHTNTLAMPISRPTYGAVLIARIGEPLRLTREPDPNVVIGRCLGSGENIKNLGADLYNLRCEHHYRHVGIMIPPGNPYADQDLQLLRDFARADFLAVGTDSRHVAAIREQLLMPSRLPDLASYWIDARHSHASEQARRFFAAVHDPDVRRLSIPEIAAALDSSPRTLRRHVGLLGGRTPVHVRMLARLVSVALDAASFPALSIARVAGAHGFLHYPDFHRAFVRYFGLRPSAARHLMGPATLWSMWSEQNVRQNRQH
jgi:AraC-like DNA-binding protein